MSIRSTNRNYFVKYYRDFGNTYSLAYTENLKEYKDALDHGWEHISRQRAIDLCVAERRRRKEDPAFAYNADSYVYPYDTEDAPFIRLQLSPNGYMMVRSCLS